MATYYWGMGTNTWVSTNTLPWSDIPIVNVLGARTGTLVTLTLGTTTGMVAGQKVYGGTFTNYGTVASIVSSTQFNTSTTGAVAANSVWYIGNQNSGFFPTAADDVVFEVASSGANTIVITIPTTTTVSCRNFTINPRATAAGIVSLAGTTLASSILQIYGDVVLGSSAYYNIASSLITTRLYGTNNTFTKSLTTAGSGFNNLYVLGNYSQTGNVTYPCSSLYFQSGSWTTNNYVLQTNLFLRLSTHGGVAAGTFDFYCGNTIPLCGTVGTGATAPVSIAAAATFNFRTTGGYFMTTYNNNITGPRATVTGQSPYPVDIKISGGPYAGNTISGTYGMLDASALTGSVTGSVGVRSYIGPPNTFTNNITPTAVYGGGDIYYSAFGHYIINHTVGYEGTTTYSGPLDAASSLVITAGRFSIRESATFKTSVYTFTGTRARGIDIGSGATLTSSTTSGSVNVLCTINITDPANFTATGDYTFYLLSLPAGLNNGHNYYCGTSSTGVRTAAVAGATYQYPNLVFYANAGGTITPAPLMQSSSVVNILDISNFTSTNAAVSKTIYASTFTGCESTSTYMSGSLTLYGDGYYNRGVNAAPTLSFLSDTSRGMNKGTTTIYSSVSVGGTIRGQNVDFNGVNGFATAGDCVLSNIAACSGITASQGGTATVNASRFTGASLTVASSVTYGATTLEINCPSFTALTSIAITAGTLKLLSSISRPTATVSLVTSSTVAQAPTLELNNNNLTVSSVTLTSTAAANNLALNGPGTLAVGAVVTPFTGNALAITNGTIVISMTGASAKTFTGNGGSYGTLNQGGAGILTIAGSNTFADMTATTRPSTIRLTAGTTQTLSAFNVNGISGSLVTIDSSSAATQATLSKASGEVSVSYLSIRDSNATGGATWSAFNSTFVSNVTGWVVGVISNIGSRFMAFF